MTFRFTVYDSPELPGLYAWELCDGSQTESGVAPTISRCLTEIAAARIRIDRATHGDAQVHFELDPSPHPAPVAQLKTPGGITISAQQDIPATDHPDNTSNSFYLRPSKSG